MPDARFECQLRMLGKGAAEVQARVALLAATVATLYLFVGFVTWLLWIAQPFEG